MTNEEMIERFLQAYVMADDPAPGTRDRARAVLRDMIALAETRAELAGRKAAFLAASTRWGLK